MTSATDSGIRVDAVSDWFIEHVGGAVGPVQFTRIAGGRSNLTYLATDADGTRWVLRRPPLGMAHSRAHDVLREATVLGRLRGTPVPAPLVVGTCDDDSVTGAPFFVMEHLDGVILRDPETVTDTLPADRRPAVATALVRTLSGLHAVDPREAGWGELADRDDYLARQLHRWSANWAQDRVRVLDDIGRTHDRLVERIPTQGPARIVHGDFRLDNCMFRPDDTVAGILDWELTTVGDPLADLGQLLVYWAQPDDDVWALENPPTAVPGFPTRNDLVEQYLAAAAPETVPDIDFYIAFNWWKIACIVEGVYTRTLRGAMGESDRSPESFGAQAQRLAAQAWRHAQRLGS
ncbi:phosphotransferase family protein [Rhodococcus sp. D2-41]|uniref:Phosphotransferase family protein n=1 Tax=Speluncibacter jeojiensis TaxID=2710754 RepID=A0A9X4RE43_9ACTN|nr:phosphotransferase family protein [Rhodococcus sp. D2-41]MDG3008974.1 phosphotransferase family protein [Rhodococcus sp. D2-41]MDG3015485.1 phosphotransferase family protein [Corynebacteriales bacterium D3-21]